MEIDILFSRGCWENWRARCKLRKPEHTLALCTKINSKWLNDLKLRQNTLKHLEGNTGKHSLTNDHANIFLGHSIRVLIERETKIDQWDLSNLTSICTAKETRTK